MLCSTCHCRGRVLWTMSCWDLKLSLLDWLQCISSRYSWIDHRSHNPNCNSWWSISLRLGVSLPHGVHSTVTDLATWSTTCGQSLSNGLLVVAVVVGTFCMKYSDGQHWWMHVADLPSLTEFPWVSRNGAWSPGLTEMLKNLTEFREFDWSSIFLQKSMLFQTCEVSRNGAWCPGLSEL